MGSVWHEFRCPGLVQVLTSRYQRSKSIKQRALQLALARSRPQTDNARVQKVEVGTRSQRTSATMKENSGVSCHIGTPRHTLRTKLGLHGRCRGMSSQREVSASRYRERLSCVFPPLASIQRVLPRTWIVADVGPLINLMAHKAN